MASSRVRRVALVAAFVAPSIVAAVGWTQANRAVTELEDESRRRVAGQCVAGYERVEQLKALGAEAVRGGAKVGAEASSEALIQIGTEQGRPPKPGVEERFRELLAGYIAEGSDAEVARVQATVTVVTECDLEAAKHLLAGAER